MKIRQIRIKNFKGIKEATYELNGQFSVFIGDNATGKTTVLDALAVALGGFLSGVGQSSRYLKKEEIRTIQQDGQPKPQLPVTVEAWGQLANQDKELCWKREIHQKANTEKGIKPIREAAEEMLKQSRLPEEERTEPRTIFPVLAYFSAAHQSEHSATDFEQKEGVELGYRNCLTAKPSAKDFLSWIKAFETNVLKFKRPREIALLEAFKKAITQLLPEQQWDQLGYDLVQDDLIGTFTRNGHHEELGYRKLSDGYRRVINFAAEIAYRCIQLNPHLDERAVVDTPGVVLIDEIDLHLHPNWQKRVVGDLKRVFPKVQFVTTTHSPFIVQSLSASEMVSLDDHTPEGSPSELPINKVATDIMHVRGERSDTFAQRYDKAREGFSELPEDPTLDDYQELSKRLGNMLSGEVNDPIFQAYLDSKDKKT